MGKQQGDRTDMIEGMKVHKRTRKIFDSKLPCASYEGFAMPSRMLSIERKNATKMLSE